MKTLHEIRDELNQRQRAAAPRCPHWRRGSIIVLGAAMLVMIMGFLAFTVDVGFIALTRAQMQAASDACVLAAAQELVPGFQPGLSGASPTGVVGPAQEAAMEIAGLHRAGDKSSITIDPVYDVRFGQYRYQSASNNWEKIWGVAPYNMVEVTLRRTASGGDGPGGDGPLPLFFAPVIGVENAEVTTKSTAAMIPGVGFRIVPGSQMTAQVLPFALDKETWDDLVDNGVGVDNFRYVEETHSVVPGCDGILEVNLYPYGNKNLPPGNRGTVDIGAPNNSTNDLKRQILYGLNDYDLSFFGGELRLDQDVPLLLNGDTGISAGMKSQLQAIKGQPRAIPIFTAVSGPGNNAMYTIEKFVGIRIVEVVLTGSSKRVMVQPCPFADPTVIPGEGPIQVDSILSTPKLIP